jgi:hypothetical protein
VVLVTEPRRLRNRTPLGQQAIQSSNGLALRRVGALYLLAAALQSGWLLVIAAHRDLAWGWLDLHMGWALAAVWCAMAWLELHLGYVGIRMLLAGQAPTAGLSQSPLQKERMESAVVLLSLGMVMDLLCFALLPTVEDPGAVLALSGLMGARVVQANLEAVARYHAG